jgi:hypothetical protein
MSARATIVTLTLCMAAALPAGVHAQGLPANAQTVPALPAQATAVQAPSTPAQAPASVVPTAQSGTPTQIEAPAQAAVVLRGLPVTRQVLLDGAPVTLGTDGTLAVTPLVDHTLAVRADDRVDWQVPLKLGQAEQRKLDVRLRKRAPWTPWLVAGSGLLLSAAGAVGYAVWGQLDPAADWSRANRDAATNQYVGVGYADAEAAVRDANLARGISFGVGGAGVAALATGIAWRLLMDLEPDEWRAPVAAEGAR